MWLASPLCSQSSALVIWFRGECTRDSLAFLIFPIPGLDTWPVWSLAVGKVGWHNSAHAEAGDTHVVSFVKLQSRFWQLQGAFGLVLLLTLGSLGWPWLSPSRACTLLSVDQGWRLHSSSHRADHFSYSDQVTGRFGSLKV